MAGSASIAWTISNNPPDLALGTFDAQTGPGNALAAHHFTGLAAGTLLVVMVGLDSAAGTCTVTSSPAVVFTRRADVEDASVEIHTGVFAAGGTIDVTSNWSVATNSYSVCQVVTNQEATQSGAATTVTATQAPNFGEGCSGDITTTRTNSIVFGAVSDRNDIAGTITYLDTATQIYANQSAGPCFYTFYKQATTLSLHTMGMSSPSTGARMGLCLYEVRKA